MQLAVHDGIHSPKSMESIFRSVSEIGGSLSVIERLTVISLNLVSVQSINGFSVIVSSATVSVLESFLLSEQDNAAQLIHNASKIQSNFFIQTSFGRCFYSYYI